MKTLLTLIAVAALAGNMFAADEKKADKPKFSAGSCCDKADKAGKACEHKCCVAAATDKKVCEKCNKPEKKK